MNDRRSSKDDVWPDDCSIRWNEVSSVIWIKARFMASQRLRIPLRWQVGVVVAFFVAALTSLWITSTSVIDRERRRASAKGVLDRAGESLAKRGTSVLVEGSALARLSRPGRLGRVRS